MSPQVGLAAQSPQGRANESQTYDDEKDDEDSNEATDEEVVSVYAYLFHNVP